MKIFETFALKKSSYNEIYLLIPNIHTSDILDIVEDFNENNKSIEKGIVSMDLQTIVGDRTEKYEDYEIQDFNLIRKKIKPRYNVTEELTQFKIDYYLS